MTSPITDLVPETAGPAADPYTSGRYFEDTSRHSADASFKAAQFLRLARRALSPRDALIRSYADVGTGSGHAVQLIARGLRDDGFPLDDVRGYDVSPHVTHLDREGVRFVCADFASGNDTADLVTLLDVFEHVPDPVAFLKEVAARCKLVALHIPLDHSLNVCLRDLFRSKLKDPGHLIFMDTAFALNLLALAGLRVLDYSYTFSFESPGRRSRLARIGTPLRRALARISPWLLSKTLGGASLMVIASTPRATRRPAQPERDPRLRHPRADRRRYQRVDRAH